MALTTGTNTWAKGLDVVVEGRAPSHTDRDALQGLADAYEAKYGSAWHFDVGDGGFGEARGRRRLPDRAGQGVGVRQQPHGQTSTGSISLHEAGACSRLVAKLGGTD